MLIQDTPAAVVYAMGWKSEKESGGGGADRATGVGRRQDKLLTQTTLHSIFQQFAS